MSLATRASRRHCRSRVFLPIKEHATTRLPNDLAPRYPLLVPRPTAMGGQGQGMFLQSFCIDTIGLLIHHNHTLWGERGGNPPINV